MPFLGTGISFWPISICLSNPQDRSENWTLSIPAGQCTFDLWSTGALVSERWNCCGRHFGFRGLVGWWWCNTPAADRAKHHLYPGTPWEMVIKSHQSTLARFRNNVLTMAAMAHICKHTHTHTFTRGLLSYLVIAVLQTCQEKDNQIKNPARQDNVAQQFDKVKQAEATPVLSKHVKNNFLGTKDVAILDYSDFQTRLSPSCHMSFCWFNFPVS